MSFLQPDEWKSLSFGEKLNLKKDTLTEDNEIQSYDKIPETGYYHDSTRIFKL